MHFKDKRPILPTPHHLYGPINGIWWQNIYFESTYIWRWHWGSRRLCKIWKYLMFDISSVIPEPMWVHIFQGILGKLHILGILRIHFLGLYHLHKKTREVHILPNQEKKQEDYMWLTSADIRSTRDWFNSNLTYMSATWWWPGSPSIHSKFNRIQISIPTSLRSRKDQEMKLAVDHNGACLENSHR